MAHDFLTPSSILSAAPFAAGMIVAECGVSGNTDFLETLSATVGPEGHVFALDINRKKLSAISGQLQTRGIQNVSCVWTDLETIGAVADIREHYLDGAVAVQLFHGLRHLEDALAEIRRLLKPGATLVCVDWTKDSTHPLAPPPVQRLTPGYVAQLATNLSYTAGSTFTPDEDHWGLLLTAS